MKSAFNYNVLGTSDGFLFLEINVKTKLFIVKPMGELAVLSSMNTCSQLRLVKVTV